MAKKIDQAKASKTLGVDAKAKKLLNGRDLVFSLSQGQATRFYPEEFEEIVATGAHYGATHTGLGWLPYEYTWFLPDNTDPYAAWCNVGLALFRVFPPKALQKWIPLAEAQRLRGIIGKQIAIARKYGLKGVTGCPEPLWLPEAVYEAHPHWRGPQVELGRIARRPYFAPSIDEPEVLELYSEAMGELAATFPEIEQFEFMANDSGSGLSWSSNLYPGMNGPARHRLNDGGARLANWLKAMQEGAARSGVDIRINSWCHGMTPEMHASTLTKLSPGLFVRWQGKNGKSFHGPGASLTAGNWGAFYPIAGIGGAIEFVAGLQGIYHNPKGDKRRCSISVDTSSLPLARLLIDAYLQNPGQGLVNRSETLIRAAQVLTGSTGGAESLASVWAELQTIEQILVKVQQKGFNLILPFGCVSTRWAVRPLVPQPGKLTDREKAHYSKHLFSIDDESERADYCRILGKPVFHGEGAMWMARWALNDLANRLDGMRGTTITLSRKAKTKEGALMLRLFSARLGAAACLVRTARNTIMYQYALDTADQPMFGPNAMDYDDNIMYDQRALVMRKIAREEADNVAELIGIIEENEREGVIVEHAQKASEESVFLLGPDLVGDLRKKLKIMMSHWHDYELLYPATKVHDFEPAPKGNILPPRTPAGNS